jgi:copper chaperone CopZ
MPIADLIVPDISCDHCERAIRGALEPLPGVESVTVDIPAHRVTVAFESAAISVERLRYVLGEEDYPVESVALNG